MTEASDWGCTNKGTPYPSDLDDYTVKTWELVNKMTVTAYWSIQQFETHVRYYQGQGVHSVRNPCT